MCRFRLAINAFRLVIVTTGISAERLESKML